MNDQSLSTLLNQLAETTTEEKVSVGDMLDTLDARSFGPILLVLSLIALSPIGAIPGVGIITASLIILISAQLPFRSRPWVPRFLRRLSLSRQRMQAGIEKSRPWVEWFENGVHERWTTLTGRYSQYVIAGLSIPLALSFFPLGLVPFGVALPSGVLILLSLGLTARDGVLVAAGSALTVAGFGLLTLMAL